MIIRLVSPRDDQSAISQRTSAGYAYPDAQVRERIIKDRTAPCSAGSEWLLSPFPHRGEGRHVADGVIGRSVLHLAMPSMPLYFQSGAFL